MRRGWLLLLAPLLLLGLSGCQWQWGGGDGGSQLVVAIFTADPPYGPPPLTVTFDASYSQGESLSFFWDFGDGTNADGVVVHHTYYDPGQYTVTLTVTDIHGNQDQSFTVIDVNPAYAPSPFELTDIDIRPAGGYPPGWDPTEWPDNYFPAGVILRFELMYRDLDPTDGIVLSWDTIEWHADRVLPDYYPDYNVGYGDNPWIPTYRPWTAGSCGDLIPWQYMVTVTVRDTAGNTYTLSEDFWVVCASAWYRR